MTRIRLSLLGLVLLLGATACDAGSITDASDLPPSTISADSTIGDPWSDGPGNKP